MDAIGRRYALVTPAHNEAEYIEETIHSVLSQTVLPTRWVIVSDRSTDGTDDIVREYAARHPFMRYVRKNEGLGRGTANKVGAVRLALASMREIQYDFIGNLDGDVSFGTGYFEYLLNRLEEDSALGIVGGRIHVLRNGRLVQHKASEESVAGAVQFFRRECFEAIGGYKPLSAGFEDGLAEIEARRHGWTTRSYVEQVVVHHREIGTINRSLFRLRFDSGVNEFRVGFDYPYHLVRSVYYLFERPPIVGTLLVMVGYLWACLTLRSRLLRPSTIRFLRKEQRDRLREGFRKLRSHSLRPARR